MRLASRLFVAALTTAAVATLFAIVVNIVTSESVPAPFAVLKPYAISIMIGLWLLTAVLKVAEESPRRRAEQRAAFLAEPEQISQAVSALRGRLEQTLRRRIAEQRLVPGFPDLPQAWRSDTGVRGTTQAKRAGASRPAKLVSAFEAVRSNRLVILGPGGIGKTTWLHTYALGELARDRPGSRVPLMLDLGQWPKGWDFTRWVEHHLSLLFPALASPGRGRRRRHGDADLVTGLLHGNRFVLLLDGLDEVAPARRGELLSALNDSLWLDQAVIMTSRPEAYHDAGPRLRAAATMVIEPLSRHGVEKWLKEAFPTERDRWQPVLRALRTPGTPVAEALSTPLMVTLAAMVFESQATDPGQLVTHPDAESVTRHLLGQYVPVVYGRGKSRWTPGQARGWLEFLATRLGHDNASGMAWWRLHMFVPRWLFAILFAAVVGVCVGVVSAYGAGMASGAVPAEPVPYEAGDFFSTPHLVLTSWLENSVRGLAGGAEPSASVTAVVAGSAFGAVAAAWAGASLLGYRDSVWWRRRSWTDAPSDPRGVREWARNLVYNLVCAVAVGSVVGAVSGAATGLAVVFGDGTSGPFLLAVRVGAVVGAAAGLTVAAFDGSLSRWGRPSPEAPTAVDLRKAFRRPKWITVSLAAGFVIGAGFAVVIGRQPALFGVFGAALAFLFLFLVPAVAGVLDDDAPTSAAAWTADRSARPQVVLRNDIASSAVRVAAALVVTTPVLLLPDTQWGARPGLVAALFFVTYTLARELWLRPWCWWLVAVAVLAARNRLPWQAMTFLEDARGRHVLRREGGTYQFRSLALQTQLARLPLTPPPPPPRPVVEAPREVPAEGAFWDELAEAIRLHEAGDPAGARDRFDAATSAARATGDRGVVLVVRAKRVLVLGLTGRRWRAFVTLNRILLSQRLRFGPTSLDTIQTQLNIVTLLDTARTAWLAARYLDAALSGVSARATSPDVEHVAELHVRYLKLVVDRRFDPVLVLRSATVAKASLPDDDPRQTWLTEQRFKADLAAVVMFGGGQDRDDMVDRLTALLADARDSVGEDNATTMTIRLELARKLGAANRWAEAEEHLLALQDSAGPGAEMIQRELRTAQRRRRY